MCSTYILLNSELITTQIRNVLLPITHLQTCNVLLIYLLRASNIYIYIFVNIIIGSFTNILSTN